MTDHKTSGFDMGKTLEWYASSGVILPTVPADVHFHYQIENPDLIGLSANELGALFSLFPENARQRSILRKVIGKPATWFHRDSTREKALPTTNSDEALSPTTIIPASTDYTPWGELKVPTADIWLYQISQHAAPEHVRRTALSQSFVHEIGHTIVQPALYAGNHVLKYPDGRRANGLDAMLTFAEVAERHPPISHYASAYRGPTNTFEGNPTQQKTAISEEICEAIAAFLLGFAYCGDEARSKNPFADRPEIATFIREFLNAELVKS